MILPSPDPAFEWRHTDAGPALVCVPFERQAMHLFTTRHWDLGAPNREAGDAPWRQVAAEMDVAPADLVRLRQVHGCTVVEARPGQPATADIVIGADPALAMAVQTADCVPLLFVDTRSGAVGAAHAGWRGLSVGVPGAAVAAMTSALGARPEDLVAAAGPSIGACCYEVGPEVRAAFADAGSSEDELQAWFRRGPAPTPANPSMPGLTSTGDDRWFFDGWAAVVSQLERAGLRSDRIFAARTCTASHPAFCSYRRDGAPAGRLAGVVRPRWRRP